MHDDFDDIFSGRNTTADTTDTTAAELNDLDVAETSEETVSQEEPSTHTTVEPIAEQVEHEEEEKAARNVPLATFLDMRDRAKAAERLADERQKQWDDFQKSQQNVASIPDPQSDPIGYADYRFAEVEQKRIYDRLSLSAQYARRALGDSAVDEAIAWSQTQAANDPRFDNAVLNEADPITWVVQQHKAAKQLEEFQTDPEAYARRIAMEKGWIPASDTQHAVTADVAPVVLKTKAPKIIPTTLTEIPAATGKSTAASEQESFDAIFNKR